jgi:hypothetical protein
MKLSLLPCPFFPFFFATKKETKKSSANAKLGDGNIHIHTKGRQMADGHAIIGLFVEKHRLPFGHIPNS